MKILVVGGAGYIGSHMVRELLENGYNPLVFDNLSTGYTDSVPSGRLIQGELADQNTLKQLFADHHFAAVIHFASSIQVGESVIDPLKYYHNNVGNTLNLISAMKAAEVTKLIFSSSAAVYGTPLSTPIREDASLHPENPYGHSKLMIEQVLNDCDRAWALKSVCLRYFNAAGAHPFGDLGERHNPETHLIPIILQVALGQRFYITINGNDYLTTDGTCIRDYIHVCDLVSAHIRSLKWLLEGGESEIFNLGNGSGYSINEVIAITRKITGHPIPSKIGPKRAGDPAILVASSKKIIEKLGWKPKFFELATIIESAWRYVNLTGLK